MFSLRGEGRVLVLVSVTPRADDYIQIVIYTTTRIESLSFYGSNMVSSRDDIIFSMYWSQCCKGCIPISVETETCLIGSDAQILLPQQRRPCLFYRDPARLPWEEVLSRVDYILATKYKTAISFLTRCSFSVLSPLQIRQQEPNSERASEPRINC